MIKTTKYAALAAVALAFGVLTVSTWIAHKNQPATSRTRNHASALETIDDQSIEKALRDRNIAVSDLSVHSVGGVVVLRGSGDAAAKERATSIVKSLGPQRVANLIAPVATADDDAIRRDAERQLSATHSLAGCTLRVDCQNGILSVTGTVKHELQKDAARSALRTVRGARQIRVDLSL